MSFWECSHTFRGTLCGRGLAGEDGSSAGVGMQASFGPKLSVPSRCEHQEFPGSNNEQYWPQDVSVHASSLEHSWELAVEQMELLR